MMQEEQPIASTVSQSDQPLEGETDRSHRLSLSQEQALQHLATGKSIAAAARSSGVSRRTIFRWLQSDPHFAAAYNAWKHETLASGRARVLAMADQALDTIQTSILQGNARVAVQVAKASGVLDVPKPGLTEPARLYRRKRLRDARWQEALAKAELDEAFNKQSRELHRHPGHCEYMIDCYIKCRREALAAESPGDRARRLEHQRDYRRYFDPMTLRLLATLDAQDAAPHSPPVPEGSGEPNAGHALSIPAADSKGDGP